MEPREETNVDRHVEKIENLWDRAKSQARGAIEWSRRISIVGKLKLDASKLQRQRLALQQDLGKRVYVLLKEGRFNPLELQELVDQIDKLNDQLNIHARSIDEASGRNAKEAGIPGHS